ncbi:hypothetical protein [Halorubrum distributum]|uniref:GATase domain protein n=2 Tax=Halorubrum distributum TaxID=29283 RepID=M0DPD2_9EURY|nr:hypothetical protein [Halorubrum terrestre]ELZ37361.1 hypothetical protein C473_01062 [Halorubrum terrestre JCM 10247]MYL18159.1 hypothetical protein [Halorubrum terrestre]MYL68732.1 hypothetical protein [Halorubrum terrestre]
MNVDLRTTVGAFALVFLAVVGVAAVGGVVLDGGSPETDAVADDHWRLDTVEPETVSEGGEVEMESSEPSNTVVVHLGGAAAGLGGSSPILPIEDGDAPTEADIGSLGGVRRGVAPLTAALVENGHEVRFYGGAFGAEPLPSLLSDADAFVTTSPSALSATDADAVESFVEAGGRTLVTSDPGGTGALTDFGSPFGVYGKAGYVYDMEHNDANYLSVLGEPTGSGSLTEGVEEAVFRGAAPIGVAGGSTTFTTAKTSQLSTTRETGSYGVAVRSDSLAVFGDSSFLEPENAGRADNSVLIGNIADFLVTGPNPDVSFGPGAGPGGAVPPGATVPPSGTTPPPEPPEPSGNETDPSGNATA